MPHLRADELPVGKRQVNARPRRPRVDWAHEVQTLLTIDYADVSKVVVVMDSVGPHTLGSPYEAFPNAKARALASRLEIRYTSKSGSCLNVAWIELSTFACQCLSRRNPNLEAQNH